MSMLVLEKVEVEFRENYCCLQFLVSLANLCSIGIIQGWKFCVESSSTTEKRSIEALTQEIKPVVFENYEFKK